MDVARAKEISASPVMANVTYGGVPIYIQQVNEEAKTARVYPLDHPEQESVVPVGSLMEESS